MPEGALANELAEIDGDLQKAIGEFEPLQPQRAVPALADALAAIRAARAAAARVDGASEAARFEADFLLAVKERDAALALQQASGTVVDAVANAETVAAGESVGSTVKVFLSHPSLVRLTDVTLKAPEGWRVERAPQSMTDTANQEADLPPESADRTDAFRLTVASTAEPTQPYWLTTPRQGMLFSWPKQGPKGVPFAPPLVTAEVKAVIDGVELTLMQPLQYRQVDPVRGELRRNLEVVPAVSLGFQTQLDMVPVSELGRPRSVVVRVESNAQAPIAGVVHVDAPSGWTVAPAESSFDLTGKGQGMALGFTVIPARTAAPGRYVLSAMATAGGRRFSLSMRTLSYPHIQTHRLFAPAQAQVHVLDLAVAPVKVGYIMGSGDQVPEALRRMGLPVTLIDPDALATGDLGRFDTIVVGIRATEARPDFSAFNGRLLDYVRRGGTLIVQYQQNDYAAKSLVPFPAQMAARVTDETAAVSILAPEHPAFSFPNRIGPADFDGWVQERNLYAFTSFDPRYTPLLESHDPGEAPQQGGELYAKIGKGQFVYTAYAWFRQLPAGVPGHTGCSPTW